MRKKGFAAGVLLAALSLMGCSGGNDTNDAGTDTGPTGDTGPADGAHDATPTDGPAPGSHAGQHCTGDTTCGGGLLVCQMTGLASSGFCSASCTPGSAADEQTACGGTGSTCLKPSDTDTNAFCTSTCTAGGPSNRTLDTGCQPDQMCTGFPFARHAVMETAGCIPFCHTDAECGSGQHCDRVGACRAEAVDTALREDGESCDPTLDPTTGASTQCIGTCFLASTTTPPSAHQGICGTVFDLHAPPPGRDATTGCPDTNMNETAVGMPNDNYALCLWRACSCGAACPTGQVCRQINASLTLCGYDDGMTPILQCTGGDAGTDSGAHDAATDAPADGG